VLETRHGTIHQLRARLRWAFLSLRFEFKRQVAKGDLVAVRSRWPASRATEAYR
jgi:hypothetical protein